MSAVVIGYPVPASSSSTLNAKILQRQNYQKENNGLETITENYIIRTADRATLAPERDTIHSAFSTATPKYSRMAVETITFDEVDGGLTTMSVVYVGLTTLTGLPPAIVRINPANGEGVYGPPIVIEAEYVTDVSETQFMAGQLSQGNGLQRAPLFTPTIKMPKFINGVEMPKNPKEPFYSSPASGLFGGVIVSYSGYCVLSKSCERRGLFLVARDTFHEVQQIAQVSSGTLQ
jgi:hypothetical protein